MVAAKRKNDYSGAVKIIKGSDLINNTKNLQSNLRPSHNKGLIKYSYTTNDFSPLFFSQSILSS